MIAQAINKQFSDKKTLYIKNTGHLTDLTKELLTNSKWTQQVVIKRSEALAKEAVDLWNWDAINRDLRVTAKAVIKPKAATRKPRAKKAVSKKSTRKKVSK